MRYPSCKLDFKNGKWRIREYLAPGNPAKTSYYSERQDAEVHKRTFESEAGELTVASAVRDYLDHQRRFGGARSRGLTDAGLSQREVKLVYLLGLVETKGKKGQARVWKDIPMDDLTPAYAQRCYSKLVESGKAAATHHAMLVAGKGFGQWLADSGVKKENVFGSVRAEGVANKRKDRLKLDDARKLIAVCYEDPHPLGGLAVAAMLTLGTRSHELLERLVQDLDQSGTVLVVQKSKSKAGERRITLPPVLRAKLRQLTNEQPNGSRIFRGMTNNTLLNHVERLCEVAAVKVITAHGLRDTWSDLTMDVLSRMDKTAKSMGHADSRVTAEHYLSAGTEQSARAAMMEDLLLTTETQDGESEEDMMERELAEAEEKLAALRARKAGGQTAQVRTDRGPATQPAVPALKLVL